MARLGRGQPGYHTGHSFLRAPTVVDEPVGAPPVSIGPGVKLAFPTGRDRAERYRSHYRLQPPQVVGEAAAPFTAEPVAVNLARPRPRWQSRPVQLEPTTLAQAPDPRIRVFRARTPYPRLVQRLLGEPQVLQQQAQPPVETTLHVKLVPRRQDARYRPVYFGLFPQAQNPFVPPAGDPVETVPRVILAPQIPRGYGRHRKAGYSLAGPGIVRVGIPDDQLVVRTNFAAPVNMRRRAAHPVLGEPQVVAPPAQPPVETTLSVNLTDRVRQRPTRSELQPPAVVAAQAQPPVETVVRVALADRQHLRARLDVQARLQPPQVVSPQLFPPVETTLRIRLVEREHLRNRLATTYLLQPPSRLPVPRPVVTDININLADREHLRVRLATHPRLRPPGVEPTPFQVITGRFDPPSPGGDHGEGSPASDRFDPPSPGRAFA